MNVSNKFSLADGTDGYYSSHMATKKSTASKKKNPPVTPQVDMERRIAEGVKKRREQLGLSANELAERSGVSRAMVSKIERLEVSPTAALLGRLCNGLGITLTSLIANAEVTSTAPIARLADQATWQDPETGLKRKILSPLNAGSRQELMQVELPSGAQVSYEPHSINYEQHIWILQGSLDLTLAHNEYQLQTGDCIRSRVDVPVKFANRGRGVCKYLVAIVR
jgi:transcriptional regulator with XRE-family HTH domain